jgi:heme/copper-type cytochrome/quinol oxidase subunit 2
VAPPPGVDYPGKTLGIVGLVLVFLTVIVGLILSIVANNQSKAAGYTNTPAKIGIILGIIFLAMGLIVIVIAIIVAVTVGGACADLGPGIHEVDGMTYTCS